MSRLSFLIATVCIVCMCACHAQTSAQIIAETEDTVAVHALDKAAFLEKVFNYEKDSVWTYRSDKPAVIDFYTTWCQPCKALEPVMKELAESYKDKVVFYKVDVEAEEELGAVFGIQSIPTILFVPLKGKPSLAKGAAPKMLVEQAIKELLLNE